jgi:hypothetical protein
MLGAVYFRVATELQQSCNRAANSGASVEAYRLNKPVANACDATNMACIEHASTDIAELQQSCNSASNPLPALQQSCNRAATVVHPNPFH